PERPVWLPPETLRVQGNLVCASLKGLSFEPCFNLTRTGERRFRGSVNGMDLIAYCDFSRATSGSSQSASENTVCLMDEDWGNEPRIPAGKVRLRDVLRSRKTVIDYIYDFGDGWEHRLTVTDVRAGEPGVSYPRYIARREKRTAGGLRWHSRLLRAARRDRR